MSYSNKTETYVFVKISKSIRHCRRENGVDTLKLNHDTLLKTLKNTAIPYGKIIEMPTFKLCHGCHSGQTHHCHV